MSDERNDLFEQEAEYEAIFRSLREKYNLDGNSKKEEEPKEFYNPHEDTELNDFFDEKSKAAEEKAEEYMYDEENIPAVEESKPVEGLSVDSFDSELKAETPEQTKEQSYEDFEWDDNTVLDFGNAFSKSKDETPTVFEDISSNNSPDEVEGNKISIDTIKRHQAITLDETVEPQDDGEDAVFELEQPKAEEPEKTVEAEIDDPATMILPELNKPERKGPGKFTIKNDDVESLRAQGEDFDFVTEGEESEESNEATIMKDVTYESINWEDFPTPRQHKKEAKKQKRAEKKKNKRGIFPKKGDSVGEVIRKIILIISVIAILASGGWLVNDLAVQPFLAKRLYGTMLDSLINGDTDRTVKSFDDMTEEERKQATKELLSKNGDYIGWLTVNGADISLPVVMAGDNEKYLHTGFDGKWLDAGTLFVNASNRSVLDKNVVIFGHNMNNGTMFGKIKKYKETDGNIYKNNPYITFHTIEGSFKYQIYAVYLADGSGKKDNFFINTAIRTNFSDEAFLNYMTTVRQKAYYNTGVTVKPDDRIITLITCDRYNLSTGRLVLVAKLIESK